MKVNLPNQLTLLRLILAIVFFAILSGYSQRQPQPWRLDVSLVIFIVAAITDYLDGYFARKHNQVTALGRILDPVVDKVLVCGGFIFLAGPAFCTVDGVNITGLREWMVVVIFGRELLVTGLRGFSEARGISFAASLHGKLKMWMQCIAAPAILLLVAHEATWAGGSWASVTNSVLVWLTVIVTTLSMIQYLGRAKYILEESAAT